MNVIIFRQYQTLVDFIIIFAVYFFFAGEIELNVGKRIHCHITFSLNSKNKINDGFIDENPKREQ